MNTETLVRSPDEDVALAYKHFMEIFYPIRGSKGSHFWRFISCTELPLANPNVNYWEIPERAAHSVNLLKGPHYRTVAKAMVINGHQYKVPIE